MRRVRIFTTVNVPCAYPNLTSAGEELAVLVERDAHHSIGCVECFLDTIPVMNININVQYARVVPTWREY